MAGEPSAREKRDFTGAEVLDVVDRLAGAGVACRLDGGWGVDALLRAQTRRHDDLDLVADSADLPRVTAVLSTAGFAHAAAVRPGLPARLVMLGAADRQVDVHPLVFDPQGNGWQSLGDGAWAAYPAADLAAVGEVNGRPVPCISAELQLRHHLGYAWDDQDRRDMAALAERFGLHLPPLSP